MIFGQFLPRVKFMVGKSKTNMSSMDFKIQSIYLS